MENCEPKVSVIVPAYNAEKYLERCLNSVVAQTMPDFECIVVDDGSIDRTGDIAEEYAKNDSRFKVIHQPNGGVSVARQAGIDAANGVYTIQFDADDWVEANMLEELLYEAEATDADMVICDFYYRTSSEEEHPTSQAPNNLTPRIVFGELMQRLHGSLANKLIRRSCFHAYDIHFIPGMNLAEDQYICLCLLSHQIKVEYIPKALYHYDRTQNSQSLVNDGIPPMYRLRPLELIAAMTDVSDVQNYFDRAILYIAYEALFFNKEKCPNYSALFKKHLPSIRRAQGFPLRVKLLVLLKVYGISIPIYSIKKMIGKI